MFALNDWMPFTDFSPTSLLQKRSIRYIQHLKIGDRVLIFAPWLPTLEHVTPHSSIVKGKRNNLCQSALWPKCYVHKSEVNFTNPHKHCSASFS